MSVLSAPHLQRSHNRRDARRTSIVCAMPSKRSSPDAEDVCAQPPRKVPARGLAVSKLSEEKVTLRRIPPESAVWAMKSTTCLSLGLDPANMNHKPAVCNNCSNFWETKLQYDLTKYVKQKRSRRYTCERPFDCSDNAEKGKLHARDRMKRLFSDDHDASEVQVIRRRRLCVTPPPSRSRSVAAVPARSPS